MRNVRLYPLVDAIDVTNFNQLQQKFAEQIFLPFQGDLRRYIDRHWDAPIAPTADGAVPLNHNSGAYADAVQALEILEDALRETNDYPDDIEREQRIAEVSAGRRLLSASRVRVRALEAVLKEPLKQLWDKFKERAIGMAADLALSKLVALFGFLWSRL